MSHLKERKEKDCLNCGAEVQGRFCQVCGQENIEPKESFWHLVTHFMYDVTHFDGKFFSTLKYLLFRPGFLSHEYLRGRRASYLHPIRMYVFTSAFFFLMFFSFKKEDKVMGVNVSSEPRVEKVIKRLEKTRASNQKVIDNAAVPEISKGQLRKLVTDIDSDIAVLKRDSTFNRDSLRTKNGTNRDGLAMLGNPKHKFKTVTAYDSAQEKTPEKDKDGFILRRFARQNIHLHEKYKDDTEIMQAIIEKFKHFFPQMLFVSLPLFALMLQMLYARRKKFFYVNHVVFTIHLYCGIFIILLATMAAEGLFSLVNVNMPGWLKAIFVLLNFFYCYKSMRNFYEQRRGKTILKYLIIMFVSLLIMTLIFTLFFAFSAMSI